MKHEGFTPGPWRLTPSPKSGINVHDEHGNPAIARVYGKPADARLIADAPALAARVEKLEALLKSVRPVLNAMEEVGFVPLSLKADAKAYAAEISAALAGKE